MLDLTKLAEAVSKVADLAKLAAGAQAAIDAANAEREAAKASLASAQADVDALTERLLAAAGSPAEAVGLAAVAEALNPTVVTVGVAPLTLEDLNAKIAAANAAV